jgi:hypothetical protein
VASYLEWNDAITARFFRPESAGTPVYLQITDELVDQVAVDVGGNAAEFVEIVLRGPNWASREIESFEYEYLDE